MKKLLCRIILMKAYSNDFIKQLPLRIYIFLNKKYFILSKKIHCLAIPQKKLNIIFSKKDGWEKDLRNGFKGLPHKLTFAELNITDITKYDLVVPLTIEDVLYLDTVRHLINQQSFHIPSKEVVHLCNDKYLFAQNLIKNGFDDYIPKINGDKKYPFFLKKKIDTWSQNTHLISNWTQEQDFFQQIHSEDYYRQEAVIGADEYATHIVFDKKILHSLTIKHHYKRHNRFPIQGEEKAFKNIVKCKHLELFSNILKNIGYQGLCCIDYKMKDNSPMIFEINPRFGGSLTQFFFSFVVAETELRSLPSI